MLTKAWAIKSERNDRGYTSHHLVIFAYNRDEVVMAEDVHQEYPEYGHAVKVTFKNGAEVVLECPIDRFINDKQGGLDDQS